MYVSSAGDRYSSRESTAQKYVCIVCNHVMMLSGGHQATLHDCSKGQHAGAAYGRAVKRKAAHCRQLDSNQSRRCRSVRMQQSGNVVVSGIVSAMTETLRVMGVGRHQYQEITQQPPAKEQLAPGDITGMIDRIQDDYQRAYFVTGVIDDSIYDPNCTFADPTVKFSGLDLWKRNLQLLVPFLIQPEIRLLSIEQIQPNQEGAQQLKAEWTLQTSLALPWRPFIDVLGSTIYTLNPEANKVVLHVESWNITAVQALQQVFTPGTGRKP